MKTDAQLKDDVIEELRMVRHVRGVTGLLNNITVRPPANPAQVQTLIEEMFKRQAEVDALRIRVEVSDRTARLYGQVHSLQELPPPRRRQPRRPVWPACRAIW
jgi:osmotically-inducible protein OsmY